MLVRECLPARSSMILERRRRAATAGAQPSRFSRHDVMAAKGGEGGPDSEEGGKDDSNNAGKV